MNLASCVLVTAVQPRSLMARLDRIVRPGRKPGGPSIAWVAVFTMATFATGGAGLQHRAISPDARTDYRVPVELIDGHTAKIAQVTAHSGYWCPEGFLCRARMPNEKHEFRPMYQIVMRLGGYDPGSVFVARSEGGDVIDESRFVKQDMVVLDALPSNKDKAVRVTLGFGYGTPRVVAIGTASAPPLGGTLEETHSGMYLLKIPYNSAPKGVELKVQVSAAGETSDIPDSGDQPSISNGPFAPKHPLFHEFELAGYSPATIKELKVMARNLQRVTFTGIRAKEG